jgi:hypothetical protein
MISPVLRPYLDDLESCLDPGVEAVVQQAWVDFAEGRYDGSGPIFSPRRPRPSPPGIEWPRVGVNAALDDYDAMALQQYGGVSAALAAGSGLMHNVRCNYGSSILPSLFGVKMFIMDEELDTLPTSVPLNDIDAIQRLLDADIPDPTDGWGRRVLEMGARFAEIARQYPNIGRWVWIYHPDCQGPLDVVEVLWGSSVFYALYDRPELVHALLERVVQTYIRFMHAWIEIVPFNPHGNSHWGFYHRGSIMLRDDSAMNLSRKMVEEFVCPYDQRLLDAFGGGAIHFCGRGDHYIPALAQIKGLNAINLSQPHLNNMDKILTHTVDRGIALLGLERSAAEAAVENGRDLHGRVHSS